MAEITDLTGYTWVGNNSVMFLSNGAQFDINATLYSENNDAGSTTVLEFVLMSAPKDQFYELNISTYDFSTGFSSTAIYEGYNSTTMSIKGGYQGLGGSPFSKMVITGGADATSTSSNFSTILQWLESNGTLTPPTPPSTKLTFDLSTIDLAPGTYNIKVLPKGDGVNYKDADLDECVAVQYTVESSMPVKGQIITMDLGAPTPAAGLANQYRVLSVEGNVAYVVAMFDASTSTAFDSGGTNTYSGKTLDTYLNTTWYSQLSATAKTAIQSTTFTQYQYSYGGYDESTHASYADYSTKAVKESGLTRYVYAMDVEDIETYFNGVFSTADIWTLFWNTSSQPPNYTYPWLRSANANYSYYAFYVFGDFGFVSYTRADYVYAARPAFRIDLSKVTWS